MTFCTPGVPSSADNESIKLTYYEAMAIAQAWVDSHADLASYEVHDDSYPPYEIPPPTFNLFGVEHYEFVALWEWDDDYANGFLHTILVDAQTGGLLSFYMTQTDGIRSITVESLDDWYSGEHVEYAPALLTADEALEVYNAWLNDHVNDDYIFRLNSQLHGKYVIFGEQYYYFQSENPEAYWYNVLVHMETGELLVLFIYDGMWGGSDIWRIDDRYDWYNHY